MNEYEASDGMVFGTPEECAEYERRLGNTKRFIDAEKLKQHYAWWGDTEQRKIFDEIVDAQPAADVQEVKHAHWKIYEDTDGIYGICSNCGVDVDFSHYGTPYPNCPFCRAYMHGKEKAND